MHAICAPNFFALSKAVIHIACKWLHLCSNIHVYGGVLYGLTAVQCCHDFSLVVSLSLPWFCILRSLSPLSLVIGLILGFFLLGISTATVIYVQPSLLWFPVASREVFSSFFSCSPFHFLSSSIALNLFFPDQASIIACFRKEYMVKVV